MHNRDYKQSRSVPGYYLMLQIGSPPEQADTNPCAPGGRGGSRSRFLSASIIVSFDLEVILHAFN